MLDFTCSDETRDTENASVPYSGRQENHTSQCSEEEAEVEDSCDGELIIDDDDNEDVQATSPPSTTTKDEEHDTSSSDLPPRPSGRNESQQKMEEANKWLLQSVMFITTTCTAVPLSAIEKAYQTHCKKTGHEPLKTPVLARVIHKLFPKATKCRLGPRRFQKIHYRNLQLRSTARSSAQSSEKLEHINSQKNKQLHDVVDQMIDEEKPNQQQEVQQSEKSEETDQNMNECSGKETNKQSAKPTGTTITNAVENHKGDVQAKGDPSATCDEKKSFPKAQTPVNDDKENCDTAAQRLQQVLRYIANQGRKDMLLRDFAHSASCSASDCTPVCLMFRRVRRHVVAARHSCSVLRLYSMLLKLHVSKCNNNACGLPACPALRATRPVKRSLTQQDNPSKRPAIQSANGTVPRPLNLSLGPRSPAESLPDSAVNSPPGSPDIAADANVWSVAGRQQFPSTHQQPVMVVQMPFIVIPTTQHSA